MPLDDRLRESMRRSSRIVDPDVRRELATVRSRTRRAVIRQRVMNSIVVAAVVVGAVSLGPRVLDFIRGQRQDTAGPITPASLVGSFRADLTGTRPNLGTAGLAGPWTLTFGSDGSVIWTPPPSASIAEGFPRDTYQVAGTSIVTNLFVRDLCSGAGVGTYAGRISGDTLRFAPVSDPCEVRRAILTSAPWTRV